MTLCVRHQLCHFLRAINRFYCAMHVVQSAVLLSLVVRPSVRLSVTLTYRGHIGWTSSKLIT